MIMDEVKLPKYWAGRTPPAEYYAPIDPYGEPPQCNLRLSDLARYAKSTGKQVADLSYEEVTQFCSN